ncbi:hypothetical protein APHAL10511_001438 [Amanita phalloides]|nr:hypothetical protein APHAL10511_001438 [Amanita phalloides]
MPRSKNRQKRCYTSVLQNLDEEAPDSQSKHFSHLAHSRERFSSFGSVLAGFSPSPGTWEKKSPRSSFGSSRAIFKLSVTQTFCAS